MAETASQFPHMSSHGFYRLFQSMKHMEKMNNWLVVLTMLKNISQREGLSHILWIIPYITENKQ